MKLAKFEFEGRTASGIVEGDHIRTIGGWFAGPAYDAPFDLPRTDLDTLLKTCDRVGTGEVVPIAQAVLAPPADHKTKIVCLGMNYKTHVAEVNTDIAPNPALFTRWLDTLVGHGQPLIRPQVSQCFDYEGELVVVIGLGGRHIPKDKAWDHVLGFTCFNDGSIRDYQRHSLSAGKNFWRAAALGPWIVTKDQIADVSAMSLETRLNDELMQSSTVAMMIYDIPTAISYISQFTPLHPGDLIATGTPGGVGSRRTPPLWMKPGDSVEVTVGGVGSLRNTIVQEF